MRERNCVSCGASLEGRWPNTKRCPPCAEIRLRATKAAWQRKKYGENPAYREKQIAFQAENREAERARSRERYATDPEYRRKVIARSTARRKWRKLVTDADIERMSREQRGRCAAKMCDAYLADGFDIDHIMPLSRGGQTTPDNLQLLCPTCNRRKGNRLHWEG